MLKETYTVAVVGAGPAGLAAAAAAARAGAHVVVFDEARAREHSPAGVEFHYGSTVLGSLGPGTLTVACEGGGAETVEVGATIWATGGQEQPLLFPGWTLPGVVTPAAARLLTQQSDLVRGRRVVVAGWNETALALATELRAAGAADVALVRSGHPADDVLGISPSPEAPAIPRASVLMRASGHGQLEAVTLEVRGDSVVQPADLLVLAHLVAPAIEGPQLAGTSFRHEPALGGWAPLHDENMLSGVPSVYVAGTASGWDTAEAAAITGRLAGLAATGSLGRAERERWWRRLARVSAPARMEARRRLIAAHAEGRGAGNLWHPEGFFVGQAADSIHHSEPKAEPWTVVCRCEDVNLAAIHAAIDAGARSPDDVKRLTRSGMGLCQWRGCRGLVSEVISARLGIPISSVALPNIRFPLRPVRIGALLSEERGATSAAQLPAHLDERA